MLARASVFRETATSFFQTDPVSGAEFFGTFQKISLEPERLLMLAVLEDAIKCVEKYANLKSGRNTKLFSETMDWIRMEDHEWLFSFDTVCDALGLDAGRLRGALLDMAAARCQILKHNQASVHTLSASRKVPGLVDCRTGNHVSRTFSRRHTRGGLKSLSL